MKGKACRSNQTIHCNTKNLVIKKNEPGIIYCEKDGEDKNIIFAPFLPSNTNNSQRIISKFHYFQSHFTDYNHFLLI